MQQEEKFDITLYRANAEETLALLKACHGFLYNCIWHIRGDYNSKEVQQIYCNMIPADLKEGREKLHQIASALGWKESDWRLSTTRI